MGDLYATVDEAMVRMVVVAETACATDGNSSARRASKNVRKW